MKNYLQPGNVITVTAPAALASGDGCLVGSLFGVACGTYIEGDADAELAVVGVFELPKVSAQAWTAGAKVYWNATDKACTTMATGNTLIGAAVKAAANPSATGIVRLNGSVS